MTITVEPEGAHDLGICACCGFASRRVWGWIRQDGDAHAAYFVHWTLGHVAHQGANIDLIMGEWGHGTTAEQRFGVALLYRVLVTGPAMMVIDAAGRPAFDGSLASRALARAEVIGSPLAKDVFALADAVLDQDKRLEELLDPPTPSPSH